MKKFLIFILGMITGVVLTFVALNYMSIENNPEEQNSGLTLFEEPGQVMEDNAYQVFQVLDDEYALARGGYVKYGVTEFANGMTVLLKGESTNPYYDDQVIKAPSGTQFRQIGIYKYVTQSGSEKTVPVVSAIKK